MLRRRRTEIAAASAAAAIGCLFDRLSQETNAAVALTLLMIGAPFVVGFVPGALLSRRPTGAPAILSAFAAAWLTLLALAVLDWESVFFVIYAWPMFAPLLVGAAVGYTICS